MATFDPLEYNYELVSKQDGVYHFQKKITTEKCVFTDIIELNYWSKQKTWIIFIDFLNLKQFMESEMQLDIDSKLTLFVGEIKNDFDFQFLMKRIVIDPQILIQLGS